MKKVKIDRSTVQLPNAVCGIMFIDGVPRFVTLENRHKIIPPGIYNAKRDTHYGNPDKYDDYVVWELQNVPGRTQIQIHIGNKWDDSEGCILIGSRFNASISFPYLMESKIAHQRFMDITRNDDQLEIEII